MSSPREVVDEGDDVALGDGFAAADLIRLARLTLPQEQRRRHAGAVVLGDEGRLTLARGGVPLVAAHEGEHDRRGEVVLHVEVILHEVVLDARLGGALADIRLGCGVVGRHVDVCVGGVARTQE